MSAPLRVIGLDLSLTSTGMSDGHVHLVTQTAAGERLEERLDRIVRRVVSFAISVRSADLAVIEAPAWSKAMGVGHEELSALRVMVRHRLWRLGVPYALVPPTTLKAYTTGNGRASKQDMVAALDNRYRAGLAAIKVKDGRYDQADALGLAAMGYAHVGQPLGWYDWSKPHVNRKASLDAVQWPDLLSED